MEKEHLPQQQMSPSLRGSGLKSKPDLFVNQVIIVSLFTREWIEMLSVADFQRRHTVSLFTREWIEIRHAPQCRFQPHSLPLYEGVD